MELIEIAENQWSEFCKGFSREHHGWLVNLWCVDTDQLGRDRSAAFENGNVLAEGQSLQGVRENCKDDTTEFLVTVGEGGEEVSIPVSNVIRLYKEESDGAHKGLRLDGGDGSSTLVEFRVAAKPEMLDGLAESEL
ncbi:MAG TPA: hypothetical protein ENH48_10020 [Halieaceae bacterium]|nr:hypothetical protein [Halieaceae bacterium]